MAKEMLTIGVIGAGRIGTVHATNLSLRVPEAKVVAIADVNLEAAKRVAAGAFIPEVMGDYHALLERKDIEAVAICDPRLPAAWLRA